MQLNLNWRLILIIGDSEAEDEWRGGDRSLAWRKKVGLEEHPLDGVVAHVSDDQVRRFYYVIYLRYVLMIRTF